MSQPRISDDTAYQAGLGVVEITPNESIWLSGWASRTKPSQGISQPIFAKSLALRGDDGEIAVIVTCDLLGFSEEMTLSISAVAEQRFGIRRASLMLNASHNHSAPVTTGVLPHYYDLTDEQLQTVERYTGTLHDLIIKSIDLAVKDMSPARLSFGQGLAGFAVNRRRSRPGGRNLPTVVDHDVPVLAVRNLSGLLRGIVFGYACHTTTINDGKINGDYAGYAQEFLQQDHAGAVAMFVAGCGADANPLPRMAPGLVEAYGRVLASAVNQTIEEPMMPIESPLSTAYGEVTLPYQALPTRSTLKQLISNCSNPKDRRELQYLSDILETKGLLPSSCNYPIQVWKFGDQLTWVSLTGEVVADYAIRFKRRYDFDRTWVSAYANQLLAYIPSFRVWEEGGYEGRDGMMEYGHPAAFNPAIEELIVEQVESLKNSIPQS
jgi:hypothetical protein